MSIAGVPYQNPLRYTGPQMNLMPITIFYREPTTTDVKYRIGSVALIGKNPTSGTQGDLWYLANFNSSGEAQWIQFSTGGTGAGIQDIETDDGSPEVDPDGGGTIQILGGTGCTVTGNGPGNTVTIDVTLDSFSWSVITSSTKTIEVNNGYIANRGSGVAFTLPSMASVGDRFSINTINAGGFTIAQNAGQLIRVGNQLTSTGVAGSIASTAIGDALELVCYEQDVGFIAINGPQGNLTIT